LPAGPFRIDAGLMITQHEKAAVTPAAASTSESISSIWSRWPRWAGYVAAAWSLIYGLLGLYWWLGGAGFPFGTGHDPQAKHVSILEHAQPATTAPVIAALGLSGAVLAVVMARARARGLPNRALTASRGRWPLWRWSFRTHVR